MVLKKSGVAIEGKTQDQVRKVVASRRETVIFDAKCWVHGSQLIHPKQTAILDK